MNAEGIRCIPYLRTIAGTNVKNYMKLAGGTDRDGLLRIFNAREQL